MAKRASKSPKSDSSHTGRGKVKVKWRGYVNLGLTEQQKAGFKSWAEKSDVWANEIPTLLDSGYTLSVAFDDYHQSSVAGLYCVDSENENAGWKLTAHAEDSYVAVLRVIFIHCVLLEGNWSAGFQPEVDSW